MENKPGTQDFLLSYLACHLLSSLSQHFHLVACFTCAGMMDVLGCNRGSEPSAEEKRKSYGIIRLFLADEGVWIVSGQLAFAFEM